MRRTRALFYRYHLALMTFGVAAACGLVTSHPLIAQEEADGNPPFLATGVRIGEVGETQAIVWTRLTARHERHQAVGFGLVHEIVGGANLAAPRPHVADDDGRIAR